MNINNRSFGFATITFAAVAIGSFGICAFLPEYASADPPSLPPNSFCKLQGDRIAEKLAELRSAEGADAVPVCREIAKLQADWVARSFQVNCMLAELDAEGKSNTSKHLWYDFVQLRRSEALPFLIRRIDHLHEDMHFSTIRRARDFVYPRDVWYYGAAAAHAIDIYLAKEDSRPSDRKLQLLGFHYSLLYGSAADKESSRRIVRLRLQRHLGKPWVSDQFRGNTDSLLNAMQARLEAVDRADSLVYREFPPLDRHQEQMIRDYCGAVECLSPYVFGSWLPSHESIVGTCIDELNLDWRDPPARDDIKKHAMLRLLHDIRAEELMMPLYSWIDHPGPEREDLRFLDAEGNPVEHHFLEMLVQYGELNMEPLAKILKYAPLEPIPGDPAQVISDDVMRLFADLVLRIYGREEPDLALAEAILIFHGGDSEIDPHNIQRGIRAMRALIEQQWARWRKRRWGLAAQVPRHPRVAPGRGSSSPPQP